MNAILDGLMEEGSIQRICSFASRTSTPYLHPRPSTYRCDALGAFEMFSKKNYSYVKSTIDAIKAHRDLDGRASPELELHRPYDHRAGAFPCRSFNLGGQTVSLPHLDYKNLAQSWCSVTTLGHFNHHDGGQFVLWDFGLVVDFPAGSTILIPSALLVHSNTPIGPGESRYSIVQYAAGGLFRWANNGFMSEKHWLSQASEEGRREHREQGEGRWASACSMFTTVEELCSRTSPY